jgi:ribose transport system substrate-binding protein
MSFRWYGGRRGLTRLAIAVALLATAIAVAATVASARTSKAGAGKWVIGVSNTLVGNGWREEMICAVKAEATASGKVSKVVVVDQNGGAAEQIGQLRNLISAGVNAIIVNPADRKALNPIINQAIARGIVVVAVDQAVDNPKAYVATNDQVAYGRLGAQWLFKQLGGKGTVVEMRGIAGVPADTDRHNGFKQALAKYPDIKVVKQTFTGWQYAQGGKQALDLLNSGVTIDGVWTSGIDYTVVNAFKTAGKPFVPIVGADNNEFLHQLLTVKGLHGVAVTNPATIGGVGTSIAIQVLEGKKVPHIVHLTPQVWDNKTGAGQAQIKKFYTPSVAPTYSSTLFVQPWTHYTKQQLLSCK